MTELISGFPGVGKTSLYQQGLRCSDSDSSQFDKALFPGNYIAHLQDLLKKRSLDYIFVSTHDTVRQALDYHNFKYTLVYPDIRIKDEYLERYADRGSPEAFIEFMDRSWEKFIQGCKAQQGCYHIELKSGEYLADVLPRLH